METCELFTVKSNKEKLRNQSPKWAMMMEMTGKWMLNEANKQACYNSDQIQSRNQLFIMTSVLHPNRA